MVAVTEQRAFELIEFTELPELAQLEALERMLVEMCDRLTEIVEETTACNTVVSRETQLQLEAFEERRSRALNALDDESLGSLSIKIGRLERLVEPLECSWDYFSRLAEVARRSGSSSRWIMLPE